MSVEPNNTFLLGVLRSSLISSSHLDRPLDVLKQRTTDRALKLAVIEYLKDKTKSFDYTLSVLDALELQMRQEIERLGGNPPLEQIIDLLHINPSTKA